jgi:predicted MFS family arabinose efflux permease
MLRLFFLWGSGLGGLFFIAQFLQTGLGFGPLGAGLPLMPWGAVTIVVPALAGRLINRYGERPFIVGGLALHAVAFAWIALAARAGLPYWQLIPRSSSPAPASRWPRRRRRALC